MNVGVDIVDLNRLDIKNEKFISHILSDQELQVYNNIKSDRRRLEFLGGRFAGKEAYLKAHEMGLGGMSFKDITILNKENGAPYLNDQNASISISHEKDYAIAMVVVI